MIRIAVVEDEDRYADQIQTYLCRYSKEKHIETAVTLFSDGDEIVEKYKGTFDIILMDIMMTFVDGMTAAEEIRRRDEFVTIIFITNMVNYAIKGYQAGALDYILKPM